MKPEQYEQFRILTKKYNIHFDGPVRRAAWPSSYQEIFLDVQKLGTAVFEEYCESSVIDLLKKPWKASTRRRTDRLTALADLCRRERRNEAGWRMMVESEVMVRFTTKPSMVRIQIDLQEDMLMIYKPRLSEEALAIRDRGDCGR